jgi:predicted negative regulator of RcsB-dependent stress response
MKKKDSTEVMRVRESVERNKISLIICTLLAIVGVIGWLSSL